MKPSLNIAIEYDESFNSIPKTGYEVSYDDLCDMGYIGTVYRVGFLAFDRYEENNEFILGYMERMFVSPEHALAYYDMIGYQELESVLMSLPDDKLGITVQIEELYWNMNDYNICDVIQYKDFKKMN